MFRPFLNETIWPEVRSRHSSLLCEGGCFSLRTVALGQAPDIPTGGRRLGRLLCSCSAGTPHSTRRSFSRSLQVLKMWVGWSCRGQRDMSWRVLVLRWCCDRLLPRAPWAARKGSGGGNAPGGCGAWSWWMWSLVLGSPNSGVFCLTDRRREATGLACGDAGF